MKKNDKFINETFFKVVLRLAVMHGEGWWQQKR